MSPNALSFYDRDMIGRTLLGRYRIVRQLGIGGMGIVYLASAKGAAGFIKPVVVKLISPGFVSSQMFSNMFVREAKILSCLKDPAIVDVIDFAEEDGFYIMVLEYVHGYQLRQWLKYLKSKGRRIPTNVCIQVVIAVCDALHYAHNIKNADGTVIQVIHRDISTPNILLDTEGHIKLVDFGIARMSGKAQEYVTEENVFKGKFPYTAPEVYSGAEASVRSDVYSCGVVLHEILTGENIFTGKDIAETVWRVMNIEVPSVRVYREDAPDEIDSVLGKALARSPTKRYQTAKQFAQALRESHASSERDAMDLLRELVRKDFNKDMAAYLHVDSLQKLDKSWRHPSLEPSSSEKVIVTDDPETKIDTENETDTAIAASSVITSVDEAPVGIETVTANDEIVGPIIRSTLSSADGHIGLSKAVSSAVETEQRASKTGFAPRVVTKRLIWIAATALLVAAAIIITAKTIKPDKERHQFILVQSPLEPPTPVIAATTAGQEDETNQVPIPSKTAAPRAATGTTSLELRREANAKSSDLQPVTRAFRKREKDIQVCFQRHAAELLGKPQITVHFRVNPSGSVDSASLTPPTLMETVLGKCLLSVATSTQFPPQQAAISFRIPLTAQRTQQ